MNPALMPKMNAQITRMTAISRPNAPIVSMNNPGLINGDETMNAITGASGKPAMTKAAANGMTT